MYNRLRNWRAFLRRLTLSLFLVFAVASCGGGALSLLTGGGPNVAANVQAGAENNQGVNVSTSGPELKDVKADNIDLSSNTVNETDYLLLLIAIIGWLMPSPAEMWRGFLNIFKKQA